MEQPTSILTIGGVQIAELSWVHRKRVQYRMLDGFPIPKPVTGVNPGVNFGYVPLSVGSLQAYAKKHARHPERFSFLTPVHRRIAIREAAVSLQRADIAAFSVYVWNIN